MKTTILTTVLMIGLVAGINAQAVRNSVERRSDKVQIFADAATIERDRAEITDFKLSLERFESSVKAGEAGNAIAFHRELVQKMEREIAQSETKVKWAMAEVSGSKSEVRSDNREIRGNRRDVRSTGVVTADDRRDIARDRYDRRDDIRDLNDDRRDAAVQLERSREQKEILAKIKAVVISDNLSAKEKVAADMHLINRFVAIMEADLRTDIQELREDGRELREDRRETRDDRRERREISK